MTQWRFICLLCHSTMLLSDMIVSLFFFEADDFYSALISLSTAIIVFKCKDGTIGTNKALAICRRRTVCQTAGQRKATRSVGLLSDIWGTLYVVKPQLERRGFGKGITSTGVDRRASQAIYCEASKGFESSNEKQLSQWLNALLFNEFFFSVHKSLFFC